MINKMKEEYITKLKKQYYNATHDNTASDDYIMEWHENRNCLFLYYYSERLDELSINNNRWRNFFELPVEVGKIGHFDTVSRSINLLKPLKVISPYGFTIQKSISFTGELVIEDGIIQLKKPPLTDRILPKITEFDTFITQNPDFENNNLTLEALKELSWGYPNVAISVFGNIDDKDRKEKIQSLQTCRNQIMTLHGEELVGKTAIPIVSEETTEAYEQYGVYMDTIITDQYVKEQLPKNILESLTKRLPGYIQTARSEASFKKEETTEKVKEYGLKRR